MRKIIEAHYPGLQKKLVDEALQVFFELSEVSGLKKKPSTSELIDWMKFLNSDEIPADILHNRNTLDIGDSRDDYIRLCEELFTRCRTKSRHFDFFYFHNYLYESVWQDNRHRQQERINLWDVIHRYGKEYRDIFVGDAAMSPYEITSPGGSVEHFNEEAGHVCMSRLNAHFDQVVWLNPVEEHAWQNMSSTRLIDEQMYPLTINGLEEAMGYLAG